VEEEPGIYREEVMLMLGALADIRTDTHEILVVLRGEEGEDEEEEDEP
jgi:hypothetical protein